MNKQTLVSILILILAVLGGTYLLMTYPPAPAPAGETAGAETSGSETTGPGKLKVANFEGPLEELNTGCYADGECYVVVGGRHITTLMGWSKDTVGTVDFDALHAALGQTVEVYAKDNGDGTYSLYGSESFYVRLK